jgi:hypothetical protein
VADMGMNTNVTHSCCYLSSGDMIRMSFEMNESRLNIVLKNFNY